MKKYICMAALLGGSTLAAHAQTSAGTIMLGGGFSFSKPTTETINSSVPQPTTTKGTQYSLAPRVGYFVADNLVLGLNTSYERSNSEGEGPDYRGGTISYQSKGNSYQIGPFVRYYKLMGDKAGFFGQAAAGYSRSSSEGTSETPQSPYFFQSTSKGHGYYANLMPGFAYFPTPKFGLEITLGSIGYGRSTGETTESSAREPLRTTERTESGFSGSFSLSSLSLGAAFYLGR